jgi:hypothetical protein
MGWVNPIDPVKLIQSKKVDWAESLGGYEFQNEKSIKKSDFGQNWT